ncbi:MAG: hypothetical protein M3Y56_15870 [Armatimonadota bacterium]|nr:hypothetical protein [Armatimonadota bacterium]
MAQHQIKRRRIRVGITAAGACLSLAALASGCSDSGSTGVVPVNNLTITGALMNSVNPMGIAGSTVRFDNSPANTVSTDSSGIFRLVVPKSSVTGNDTLSFYNSNGFLVATAPVPAAAPGVNSVAVSASIAPPLAPTVGSLQR